MSCTRSSRVVSLMGSTILIRNGSMMALSIGALLPNGDSYTRNLTIAPPRIDTYKYEAGP